MQCKRYRFFLTMLVYLDLVVVQNYTVMKFACKTSQNKMAVNYLIWSISKQKKGVS